MEPKYVLIFESKPTLEPFAIYEQMASYILTPEQRCQAVYREPPIISQRLYGRYDRIEQALRVLCSLNGDVPILLAYSTKEVDNTFTV